MISKASVRKHGQRYCVISNRLKKLKEAKIEEITDLGINRKTANNIKEAMAEYALEKNKEKK